MVNVQVRASVPWNCLRAKGGNWIGVCDGLGLTIQSETWAALMADIAATLDAMFKDLLKTRELDRLLREHGWEVSGAIPDRPTSVHFDVPFVASLVGPSGSPPAVPE